jgi:hypothetical protein
VRRKRREAKKEDACWNVGDEEGGRRGVSLYNNAG